MAEYKALKRQIEELKTDVEAMMRSGTAQTEAVQGGEPIGVVKRSL